jgi:hypothetical protein
MASQQNFDELSRDEQIKLIWMENQWLYIVVGFFLGLVFFPVLQALVSNAGELLLNLAPEAIGIAVTVLLIDRLNRRREERNAIRALKDQLIREASSRVNDVAVNAVHQMRKRGWLVGEKGLLAGEDLTEANLKGVDFYEASLEGTNFVDADLETAILSRANLKGANLFLVRLQEADLSLANLEGANLSIANLKGAGLFEANLQNSDLEGARLISANLKGANLQDAILDSANFENAYLKEANFDGASFNAFTVLPNGQSWTPDIDLWMFIDPEHPNFWQPSEAG